MDWKIDPKKPLGVTEHTERNRNEGEAWGQRTRSSKETPRESREFIFNDVY